MGRLGGGKPHSLLPKVLKHWETIRSAQGEPIVDTPEGLLTPQQLADILGIRTTQVYDLTRKRLKIRGREPLPHIKVSRKCLRFKWSEVAKWLDEQRERRAVEG